jgi:CDP-diacylglycerol--glycerol-3-phosphate 3-phosphatidyltransferase
VPPDEIRRRNGRRFALALTWLRLALAPVLPLLAATRAPGWLLAALLAAGFVSDVFDGVIARRFGVADAGLRSFDSMADNAFYAGAALVAWLRHADALAACSWGIIALLSTMLLDHLAELYRFGRFASYHMYSARVWGLLLFVALFTLFAGGPWWPLALALAAGTVANLESLAATVVLRTWQHDVPTFRAALRLRAAGS